MLNIFQCLSLSVCRHLVMGGWVRMVVSIAVSLDRHSFMLSVDIDKLLNKVVEGLLSSVGVWE